MPNTYTQIYIQFVFAVQNRTCCIQNHWKEKLYQYMTGIVSHHGHKLYTINGMPDHIHTFVSMNPTQSASDLMYHLKRSSSLWINERKLVPGKFSWQEGFGAFSYGRSQIKDVIAYIENQELHHKKFDFIEEYESFLKAFEIEYDTRYTFKRVE
jgi:putative transposase